MRLYRELEERKAAEEPQLSLFLIRHNTLRIMENESMYITPLPGSGLILRGYGLNLTESEFRLLQQVCRTYCQAWGDEPAAASVAAVAREIRDYGQAPAPAVGAPGAPLDALRLQAKLSMVRQARERLEHLEKEADSMRRRHEGEYEFACKECLAARDVLEKLRDELELAAGEHST